MAEAPDNLILHYLRRIDEKVDAVHQDNRDLKVRLGRLETNLAQLHVAIAEHSNRFDHVDNRLDRIERRLNLAES